MKKLMVCNFRVGPTTSFLAKCYNEASVANCEDNLGTIYPIEIMIEMPVFQILIGNHQFGYNVSKHRAKS
jgi:hypothetical protein